MARITITPGDGKLIIITPEPRQLNISPERHVIAQEGDNGTVILKEDGTLTAVLSPENASHGFFTGEAHQGRPLISTINLA